MFRVYILIQLAFVSVLGHVEFTDCGSLYELTEVNIQGCDGELCHVTVGEDVLVSFDFYANFVSQNLDQDVVINVNYLNLRTQVTPERCGIYDCPVMSTGKTSLTSVMSVPYSIALNQRGVLTWIIENEYNQRVLCYEVRVQTQSRLQKLLREYIKTAHASRDNLSSR